MKWKFTIPLLIIVIIVVPIVLAYNTFGEIKTSYTIVAAELEALEDKEYYYLIIDDINNATDEILIAMYSMIYDPDDPQDWANDLIRALVNAHNRGVAVRVIIEYRTYWGVNDENLDAFKYLKEHGVEVKLDNDTETDHYKLVIIDKKVVYVGSHNWSESGLYYNREVSIRAVDEGIARELREYFYQLWRSLTS